MSRRFSKRIILFLVVGSASIFLFIALTLFRTPAKTGWNKAVQNMHIQDDLQENEYEDGVNLGGEDQQEDVELQDDMLIPHAKGKKKVIDDVNDYDNDEVNKGLDGGTDVDDDEEIGNQNNNNIGNLNDDTNNGNEEFNNNAFTDMQRKNNNAKEKKFPLPSEFYIKNSKGEKVGVKHFPNGAIDYIKLVNERKNQKKENINNGPAIEDELGQNQFPNNNGGADGKDWKPREQGAFGAQQGGFGAQQGGFGAQQGGFGAQQGGFGAQQGVGAQQGRVGAQQGGFGAQQGGFGAQRGGFGAQQGGFGAQQGGFGAQQARGNLGQVDNGQNIGPQNIGGALGKDAGRGMQTFDEFLRQKNRQNNNLLNNLDALERLVGPQGDNNNQDSFLGNRGGDVQNGGWGANKAVPDNPNRGAFDNNQGNNLAALQDNDPLLGNWNKALQDKKLAPDNNNDLQNMNPFWRENNFPQNPQLLNPNPWNQADNKINDPKGQDFDINPFNKQREIQGNLNPFQNKPLDAEQLPKNKDGFIEQDGRQKVNDAFKNENQNKDEESQQNESTTLPQLEQPQTEYNQSEIVANRDKIRTLLEQNIHMEDLTAAVSIEAKCIEYKFPTDTGRLCIHDRDADPEVSGIIEAEGVYEKEMMDQIQFILSNDSSLGFVDLGAGIGIHSMAAAIMGRDVLAVEPFKINCRMFHKNAVENHVTKKIVLLRHALDKESYVGMTRLINNTGSLSKGRIFAVLSDIDPEHIQDKDNVVRVTTLNNIIPATPFKRALLKLDVNDGMEATILDASSEFFKSIDVTLHFNTLDPSEKEWCGSHDDVKINPSGLRTKTIVGWTKCRHGQFKIEPFFFGVEERAGSGVINANA